LGLLKSPPALQLPAEAHEIESISAEPPGFRAAVPGTSSAFPQVPLLSSTTKAWSLSESSEYHPPALQLPADGHEMA
jgi:hypothetical protein